MGKTNKPAAKAVKPHLPAASLHSRPARSVRLMQDVVRPARLASKTAVLHPKVAPAVIPKVNSERNLDNVAPSQLKHHQPQTAHTLMRSAVKKPLPGIKRQFGARTPTDILISQPSFDITPKWSANQVDPLKAQHSKHVKKSKFIQRFAPQTSSWSDTPSHYAAAVRTQSEPAQPASQRPKSMDIFQRAIEHANSHEQKRLSPRQAAKAAKHATQTQTTKRPVHHRLPSIVATSLAVLLLAGFITYQNKANITLRFADAKAGFHASLPSFRPSGFAVGKFHYSAGSVAIKYARPGTSRNFTFSQQVSTLNSQTLLDSNITPHSKSYQTLNSGGRTIYIYGNNDAAWVDGGILYQITSNGNLSTSDILSIATSV